MGTSITMFAMYELIIIGGGPAGAAAGVYAARKKMKVALVAESFGGQSVVSDEIQNWIGSKNISGVELAGMLEEHVKAHDDIEVVEGDLVTAVEKAGDGFVVKTRDGKEFKAKTLLVASGSRRRRLGIPGEDKFDGKGVAFCSTCDAPIFQGKEVAVVGGGNAGLEAVVDLIPYATKIYLMDRNGKLKGDPTTQDEINADPKVEIVFNAVTKEVIGDQFVSGLKYTDSSTGEDKELKVEGVFVEIGAVPNTDFVKDLVELNKLNEIVVDHKTQRASLNGIWAAGDSSDVLYKQNNISAGDAIKAVLNIYSYLQEKGDGKKKEE